jgi:hypothetical protein
LSRVFTAASNGFGRPMVTRVAFFSNANRTGLNYEKSRSERVLLEEGFGFRDRHERVYVSRVGHQHDRIVRRFLSKRLAFDDTG